MSGTNQSQDDTSVWTAPRFVVAAVVVALIAVFAVVLVVTRPSDDDIAAAPPPPPASGEVASSAPVTTSGSTCGLEDGDQVVPVAAPPDTEWELVGSIAAPTAPETFGPGRVRNGLRSCFARSPLGALYAAANFLASASDPDLRLPTARYLTAEGAGRDAAIGELETEGPGSTATGLQIVAFTFLNYDNSSTVIDVAMKVDAALIHLPVSLRWEEGDWKTLLSADGDPFAGLQPLPDLTGYVPWAGA